VARADIEGLRTCSSVLALLDGSDFGTVFETGWAECAHIPVVGYATKPDEEGTKMLTGLSGELHNDLSTAVYRAAWRALGAPALPRPAS
jgi:nucleoside 2-deoxyribosyltransferase